MPYQPPTGSPPQPPTLPQPYPPPPFSAAALRPPSRAPWLVTALVAGVAGYGGYRAYGERTRLLTQLGKSENVARLAKTAVESAEGKLAALQEEKEALETARDNLAKSVEAKSSELAVLKGTTDKLREQMKDEIAKGDIQLTESGGRLRVGLVDKILFDSGAASISKDGQGVLARVGAVLAGIDDRQIQVSGHTDNAPISDKLRPQYPTNWELSVARATNVVRFLQENTAVPADRLVASGYGEHQPIASNRTMKGRAKNRRIELLLTPSLAPKRISPSVLKERKDHDRKGK